ncbi:MAG: rhodanese-like domain-containing protein [Malacoplasma sp.]
MLSISVEELLKIPNITIIDIRSEQSYNNNHIPNAKNIPLEKLISNYKKYLNINQNYYIYCQQGIKSIKICQMLSKLGYKVANIKDGYEAWILKK